MVALILKTSIELLQHLQSTSAEAMLDGAELRTPRTRLPPPLRDT